MTDNTQEIINHISICKDKRLYNYPINILIDDAENFGIHLKTINLKTNQIRKFLDTMNRLKVQVSIKVKENNSQPFDLIRETKIYTDLVLLKQKLAYAAGRNKQVKPLKDVMDIAIEKVKDSNDFERLFQLVESIIAYHKAAGGQD